MSTKTEITRWNHKGTAGHAIHGQSAEWTLQGLAIALRRDLDQCTTKTERLNCEALNRIELRQAADELSKQRKLTPGELAIAQEAGWLNG